METTARRVYPPTSHQEPPAEERFVAWFERGFGIRETVVSVVYLLTVLVFIIFTIALIFKTSTLTVAGKLREVVS